MSVFLSHFKEFPGTYLILFGWIRIRIVFAMIRIRNKFIHILDPDPYQNDTDPPHCECHLFLNFQSENVFNCPVRNYPKTFMQWE